jgi:hypothetical protein
MPHIIGLEREGKSSIQEGPFDDDFDLNMAIILILEVPCSTKRRF